MAKRKSSRRKHSNKRSSAKTVFDSYLESLNMRFLMGGVAAIFFIVLIIVFFPSSSESSSFTEDESSIKGCGEETVLYKVDSLCWQQSVMPGTAENWQAAIDYCNNLVLGDHDDWRLPNVNELNSIVDSSSPDVMINPIFFRDTEKRHYWTSSPYEINPKFHWYIHFERAYQGFAPDFNSGYGVRCVRDNTLF